MAIRFWRSRVRGRLAAVGLLAASWTLVLACAENAAAEEVAAEEVAAEEVPKPAMCQACEPGKYGTQITWAASREDAVKQAKERGKLVLLMQLSGNFARQEFT
jgi:hypothetical protein